jgi:putative membrane protein
MRKLAQVLSGLFLLLVFIASITFSYFNTTPVTIRFANWQIAAQPVSVWIIGAFVTGGITGLVLGMGLVRNLKSRVETRRLTRQLEQTKQELNKLRSGSLKDK